MSCYSKENTHMTWINFSCIWNSTRIQS